MKKITALKKLTVLVAVGGLAATTLAADTNSPCAIHNASGERVGSNPSLALEHIAITVKDPVKMIDWWKRNLGMTTTLQRKGGSAFIADRSGRVAFEVYGPDKNTPAPDYFKMSYMQLHFGFYSNDVDGDIRRLVMAGAKLEVRESAVGLEGAMLRDPFGIPIQIMKREKPVTLAR